MTERCVEEDEVYATVADGEIFPVKFRFWQGIRRKALLYKTGGSYCSSGRR